MLGLRDRVKITWQNAHLNQTRDLTNAHPMLNFYPKREAAACVRAALSDENCAWELSIGQILGLVPLVLLVVPVLILFLLIRTFRRSRRTKKQCLPVGQRHVAAIRPE